MAFDYKKEYKEFYMPKNKPGIIEIPKMNYIAVRGKGNPNEENGEYKSSIGLLYGIAFTIKMSYKGTHKIEGFFEYVVPPLEGLWWCPKRQSKFSSKGVSNGAGKHISASARRKRNDQPSCGLRCSRLRQHTKSAGESRCAEDLDQSASFHNCTLVQ